MCMRERKRREKYFYNGIFRDLRYYTCAVVVFLNEETTFKIVLSNTQTPHIIKGGYPHAHACTCTCTCIIILQNLGALGHLTYARDDSLLLHVLGHPSHHRVRLPGPRLTVGKDTNIVPTKHNNSASQ